MELEILVTPGLGDNSYVLASEGLAAVIDPQRDVRRYLDLLEARGLTLAWTFETHVHNDYVSGSLELRQATGAQIVGPKEGGYGFDISGLAEGDEIPLGAARLVAMETPGHTPEHLSYLVYEGASKEPVAVFTGGSLMVGGAGRTDLLGPAHTDALTRAQFRTLRRLGSLPDTIRVLPTHGAGSFCGAGSAPSARTGTLAEERSRNDALGAPDEEEFVRRQLAGLPAYPRYYSHMAPINRAGPPVLGSVRRPAALQAEEFAARIEGGAWVVDGRSRRLFARGHIPGSVNVELRDDFASYVGWVIPFGAPLLLVLPEPEEAASEHAATQLVRIGLEASVAGYLAGGLDTWRASGRTVSSYPTAVTEELCRELRSGRPLEILDVRQRTEWDEGHIEGSHHLFVGDLPGAMDDVPTGEEVWTICASGRRASLAASLLDRAGIAVRLVGRGGVSDVLAECADAAG